MSKEKKVIDFYVLCNTLKDVVRTGWKDWGVDRFRVESIAEHVFGTQMLAVGMWSQFEYELDISKVIIMLAVHEMKETIIGDITCFQIEKEEKQKMGREAVVKIFSKLGNAEEIKNLIFEFDEGKTPEAKFAFYCDKLECDIQAKLYGEQNCVDLNKQEGNKTAKDKKVKQLLKKEGGFGEMWLAFGQERYGYDENFMSVSTFAKNNKISKGN